MAEPDRDVYAAAERLVRELARGSLPEELSRPLSDALREVLIAMRAILDYSIARLERSEPDRPQVEDIPID